VHVQVNVSVCPSALHSPPTLAQANLEALTVLSGSTNASDTLASVGLSYSLWGQIFLLLRSCGYMHEASQAQAAGKNFLSFSQNARKQSLV